MRAQARRAEEDTLLAALTPREREVLACLAAGAGRDDVARQLYLSANTVRTHLQNLMAKLGVHSTLEAVALTRRAQLDYLPPVRSLAQAKLRRMRMVSRPDRADSSISPSRSSRAAVAPSAR